MPELVFFSGTMDCGKSTLALQIEHNRSARGLQGMIFTRNDRAGLLAEFAVDIAEAARSGDTASADLLREAGREAARSALAAHAHVSDSRVRIALTGGVAAAGSLVEGFRTEASRMDPTITIVEPAGGPLDGALTLGHLGAGGKLSAQDRVLWT